MGFMRCQAELANDSLLPADRAINVWHWRTPGDVGDVTTEVSVLLDTFYTAIDDFLSASLTGNIVLKFYDLEDPEPRAPVDQISIAMGAVAATAYPGEVACAMSFQGPIVSGFSQARRRGRIFLGPLASGAGSGTTPDVRPSTSFRSTVCTAADNLMSDSTTPGLIWSVFSPSTAGAQPWDATALGNAFVTITNGWVDDAFDTIRSRGVKATTRTTWT